MAIYKPPKLKSASEFLTNKKVNRSSPEEYYEVTSQKFSLYDPDTAYSGSQRAKQEKESERRLSLPKVNLQELRDNSINQFAEYLPQDEVSRLNRIAHQGEQPKQSLMERLTSNVTDENRATLGVQKKPTAPRVNSQVATLAGKQPEQYSQQQSAEGDRFLSDGNIKGQVASTEKQKTDIGAVGRSLRDLPRNIASGTLNALEQGSELLTFGMQSNDIKPRTRESWEKMNQTNTNPNKPKTYEEYLASIDKMNQDTNDFQEKVASVGSEVTSDTTLFEKMVKGAAQSLPSSLMTAAMGGGLAGVAGAFVSNPIVVETIRTTPLFASGTHSGLKTAEELGLTGAKKYSYAVLSGLLEAGTERLSSLGLEGKLLGKKTSGGVGGTKEFLRAIFEESGSEMLNEVGQQLLTGQYTSYEDFELDFENIIVAGGSAALMGGFGAVGELSNGLKYRTVGTVDNQVIIETEDGRRENVNPEIVMRHQLANGRTARMAQEMLKADTEIQELAKNFGEQEQIADTMPVEDTTTPQEAFEVENEPSMPIEEKPITEPLNEAEVEKVSEEVEVEELRDIARRNATNIESLNVPDIGVDPKRFQFKSGLDEKTGAGSELDGTDTFNPDYAGTIQVWRDKTGKDWVVNGHHRLELARRAGAKNINARIFHETDGIDESRARQIGAEQNIAERSGTAKDAALIFRETGYSKDDLAALGLSVKTKFIEQAYNISKLNDRIWDKVVNKQIREEQASMIGEAFHNDSDKQNAVMDYINEEGYITDKELKEVIDGVRFSETNYEEQYTLMGLETVAKSNFKEKVKLTTKIKQSIGSEKSAFSKLVKAQSAKKIEDVGNILNQEANESRLDLLQNINEIIDFGKNRQGDPINIIINKYANEVQNGAKLNFAADKAIEEITAIVQDGGYIALAMRGIEEQSNQQMMIGDEINETQQNEFGDVEGTNQDSERREEIEGQGSLFDFTESENTTAEEVNTVSEREPLETRLDNMISKNLIDSPNNRRVATNLNKKIVELGGKDRSEEFKKVETPKVKKAEPKKVEERENAVTLPADTIRRLNGNSMFNRGNAIQSDANAQLNEFERKFGNLKDLNAEQTEYLEERRAEYEKMVRDLYSQYADKESRHVSWAVTGRSNYPAAKMNKIMEQNIRFSEEMSEKFNGFMENTSKKLKALMSDEDQIQRFREGKWTSGESIDAADPLAIQKYEAKLEYLKGNQEKMKAANREAMKAGNDRAYPPYMLTNNNANIKSTEQMLSKLKARADRGAMEEGPVFGGGHVVFNNEADRLQIFFDEKPSEEIRGILKKNGFRYSPKNNDAWQRQLTGSARYALKKILPQISTEPLDADLTSSDDDLMVNNMAMEAEIEPMDSSEPVTTDLPEIEMMEGYKTSATKKSLLKSPNVPEAYKQNVITDDPMMYKESNRKARMFEANEAIDTKTYDVAVNEVLETHKADPKAYTAKEGQATIQALMNKNFELRKQFKDNGFYQEQYEKLQKVWRETGTEEGQALNMRKEFYGDSVEGKILEAERIVEESKTKQHKELEERMNDILDDIFNKTIELDENGRVKPDSDFEEVIAELKKEFGLTNAWIEMLRKSLDEGTLTKTKMKEIIKEKMGIPTLTMAEIDKITEIMDRLDALDPNSETYAKDKETILQDATMVYAQKDVTFWTKLSTYQTMAMLMNVKTTLRNEIGNLLGFTTAQVDDVFSFFFDEGIAKITKQRGTVNPRSPFKLKYKDGVKKSFEAYGSFLADASENKYVKRRVFAPGSMMGKLEGVMGVMLSDARWKQPRVEFLLEQIATTEKYAKERGLEYDAETARLKENINFIADYDTFNFNSKPAQVLDGVVKSMNKIGNKDFGLGTLFVKFAKTPMNIIQYQLDHIGWDLFREGVKLSKLSKKIGFENALKQNQGRISRALGKTATGMTYVTLGAMLSNLGAFVDEEEDKDVKNILEAQGIKGGYFNFSALSRSISSGKPSSYKDGDTVISVNWMLPVAPFLLLGSRFANAKDEKEAQDITDTVQSLLEAGGSSLQDFAELPFNRTLGILTNSYDSGMDKFNKLVGGTVTGFVPSVVKQVAQGIDPTSKQYSKNSGEAVVQQIKATIPGLRNTVPNRFDVTGETQTMTDNSTTAGNIFEMLLNPAYRDTIEADKDLQKVVELNKKVGLPSLPKITNGYFSYKSNRYEMTQEEHQEFQSVYWNAYKRTYNKKKDGNFVNAHDYAMNQAKINYLKKKKVKFETTSSGNLK